MREATLLLAGLLAFALDATAIEIGKFEVSILLDPDGTIFVTETIDVDFGVLERHGIFRTIPMRYARTETLAGVPIGTTLDADVATAPERGRFSWNQLRRRPRLERLRSERRRKRRRFRWRRRTELVRAQNQG